MEQSRYLDQKGYLKTKVAQRDFDAVVKKCKTAIKRGDYEIIQLEQDKMLPEEIDFLWSLPAAVCNSLYRDTNFSTFDLLARRELNRQRKNWLAQRQQRIVEERVTHCES